MGPWLLAAVGVTVVYVKWENSTKNKNPSWSILWQLTPEALSICQDCITQELGVKLNHPPLNAQELFNPLYLQLLSIAGCF